MPDIHFTTDPAANALIGTDPFALLVGMVLYQQVPVEKAFAGPSALQERLGGRLDAATVAAIDPEALEELFRRPPALHRFPANMAKRVQAVAAYLTEVWGGDAAAIWTGASDGEELLRRLTALPGFGDYKARVTLGVLANHFAVRPAGYEALMPDWPSIADVESAADLEEMKVRKKAWKESGAASRPGPSAPRGSGTR